MGKKGRRHTAQLQRASTLPNGAGDIPLVQRWPALTGLRGLAALGVVLLHAYILAGQPTTVPRPLAWLFSYGWSGVDVFFTLSAFLLTIPFLQAQWNGGSRPLLRDYARHRLLRILPAYYAQAAVLLLLGLIGAGGAMAWNDPAPRDVLANLLFLYGAMPTVQPQVPPWWTLPVELGFYLLLPWFARCLRPRRWVWLLLGIAASLGYRFCLMHAGLTRQEEIGWVEHLPGRLHQFLVGMLAAYVFVRLQATAALPSASRANLLAIASAVVFLALPALGFLVTSQAFQGGPIAEPLLLCWHLYASVVIGILLVALAAGAPLAGRALSAAPLQALGVVSYSLYLWHYPVMLALRESLGGLAAVRSDFWQFLFYGVLFSSVAAGVSWWLVERPAQRWSRQVRLPA